MKKKYLEFYELNAYKISFSLSNYVWEIVVKWNYLAQKTVGSQWIRAVDSISANLAEGFGRYTKKAKIGFYRYSFASRNESIDWLEKSRIRKLISDNQYAYIKSELDKLPREINSLIKFTNDKLST